MGLTSPQILVIAADPAVAGSLVRRVRDFGVSAAARSDLPSPSDLEGVRGLIVADATVTLPPVAELPLPVLAVGDGFAAMIPPESRWRPSGPAQSGFVTVRVDDRTTLWAGNGLPFAAWFRRSRGLDGAPAGLTVTAWDPDGRPVGIEESSGRRFAVQFHPQRSGSESARQMLRRFVRDIAGCVVDWRLPEQVPGLVEAMRRLAGEGPVVVLVSGGPASLVTAALARRALGADRVVAVHADTGVLRQGESERVLAAVQALDLHRVEVHDLGDTLWPLLLPTETVADRQAVVADCLLGLARQVAGRFGFPSPAILVGNAAAWPVDSGLVSPLLDYDRSEWQQLGRALGVPDDVLMLPPFPLSGLAARCDGPLTTARLAMLRQADARLTADLGRCAPEAALSHVAVRLTVPGPGRETLIIEAHQADDGLAARPFEATPGFWPDLAERLRAGLPAVRHIYLDLSPLPAGARTD